MPLIFNPSAFGKAKHKTEIAHNTIPTTNKDNAK